MPFLVCEAAPVELFQRPPPPPPAFVPPAYFGDGVSEADEELDSVTSGV